MTERNDGAMERVAIVESALANVDVVSQLAAFLDARDLCRVGATCRALGSANDGASFDGLSMAEEAARRMYEGASGWERSCLPKRDDETWTELYHHLLMLRSRLIFDQLVGDYVEYRGGDKATVQGWRGKWMRGSLSSEAICGNHIMRGGKHWATFISSSSSRPQDVAVGVIRPLPGLETRAFDEFAQHELYQDLLRERTDKWEGNVDCCKLNMRYGSCYWYDWTRQYVNDIINWENRDDYDRNCRTLGLLLDLDDGILSLYQNGRRLGTLKDGLAGEYCWAAGFRRGKCNVSIHRGYRMG